MLLKGGGALDITSVRKKPKEWIPDTVWLNVVALSAMDAFRDILDSVFRNDGLWRQWYDQEAPEMAKVRDSAGTLPTRASQSDLSTKPALLAPLSGCTCLHSSSTMHPVPPGPRLRGPPVSL